MYSVLVLGYIPGTDIQITFRAWLVMAALLAVGLLAIWLLHKHRHAVAAHWQRLPLPASQLHVRLFPTAR